MGKMVAEEGLEPYTGKTKEDAQAFLEANPLIWRNSMLPP